MSGTSPKSYTEDNNPRHVCQKRRPGSNSVSGSYWLSTAAVVVAATAAVLPLLTCLLDRTYSEREKKAVWNNNTHVLDFPNCTSLPIG